MTTPRALDDGTPLYVAPTSGYRILITVLLSVLTVLTLVLFVLVVMTIVTVASLSESLATTIGVVALPLLLVLLVLIGVNAWLQWHMRFAVTTQGLTVTPPYRRCRFIAWSEVATLEPSQGLLMRGATVVVLQDGTRLIASLTNASGAFAHPPAPAHLGPGDGSPTPLRAARDGLARFRRGEFSSPGR